MVYDITISSQYLKHHITFDRLYNHEKGQRELSDTDKLIAKKKNPLYRL